MTITRFAQTDDGKLIEIRVPSGPLPTPDELAAFQDAFSRVQDPTDWKNAIDATVTVQRLGEIDVITDAIEFFTATIARVDSIVRSGDHWTAHVTAPGYYAGPAN